MIGKDLRQLYLDLVKRCVADLNYRDDGAIPGGESERFMIERRQDGNDWPTRARTMIGLLRLENFKTCLEDIISNGVHGDVMETGVWRGWAVIFTRAVLAAYGITDRTVWVADSFAGLPPPDPSAYPRGHWNPQEGLASWTRVRYCRNRPPFRSSRRWGSTNQSFGTEAAATSGAGFLQHFGDIIVELPSRRLY